jgi:hypothetical protein
MNRLKFSFITALLFGLLINFKANAQNEEVKDFISRINANLDKNLDTSVLVNDDFAEVIFANDKIESFAFVKAISRFNGRFSVNSEIYKDTDSKNIETILYNYDKKPKYFYNPMEYSFSLNAKLKNGNNYLSAKSFLYSSGLTDPSLPNRTGYDLTIKKEISILKDTLVAGMSYQYLTVDLIGEYNSPFLSKKETWRYYTVNKKYEIIIEKESKAPISIFLKTIISSNISKEKFHQSAFESYEKINSKFYLKEYNYLYPRYDKDHIMGFNSEKKYTLLFKKSSPAEIFDSQIINSLPFKPFYEFGIKVDYIPNYIDTIFKEKVMNKGFE